MNRTLFSRLEPLSNFTCGIVAIMKWGKTNGIYLMVFPKRYIYVNSENAVQLYSNNVKSQPKFHFYILLSNKNRRWHWLQALRRAQQRLRFCTPRYFFSNCMQRKWISAVLWKNPIKHASNIHPDVFNSFYWAVKYGESHRPSYKEIILSMVTPFFLIWTPQQKSSRQVFQRSITLSPSAETTLGNS